MADKTGTPKIGLHTIVNAEGPPPGHVQRNNYSAEAAAEQDRERYANMGRLRAARLARDAAAAQTPAAPKPVKPKTAKQPVILETEDVETEGDDHIPVDELMGNTPPNDKDDDEAEIDTEAEEDIEEGAETPAQETAKETPAKKEASEETTSAAAQSDDDGEEAEESAAATFAGEPVPPEEEPDEEAPYQEPRKFSKEREPDIIFNTASDDAAKDRHKKRSAKAKTKSKAAKKPEGKPTAQPAFEQAARLVGPYRLPERMDLGRVAVSYNPALEKKPATIEGTKLALGLNEYRTLVHLFHHAGRPVHAHTIGQKYFGGSQTPRSSALASITRLRAAFDKAGQNGKTIIETTPDGHVLHLKPHDSAAPVAPKKTAVKTSAPKAKTSKPKAKPKAKAAKGRKLRL